MPDPTLTSLVIRYVREREQRGELVRDTAAQYESRLLEFAATFDDVAPTMVTRKHVLRWQERPELSQAYRRARFSVLRGFCQWCVIEGHMHRDPTLGLKPPKLPDLLPRCLSPDESGALMLVASTTRDPRVRLACLLELQELLRRGEMARIQLGDVDRRRRVLAVRGKGGRSGVTRRVPITDETWSALIAYLPHVRAPSGPLFRSERWPARGISGAWLGELVTRAMYDAGVKHYPGDGRSPHALRHTGAQDLADNGVDMRKIQKALGHASLNTSLLYVRGAVGDLADVMSGRTYTPKGHTTLADAG